MILVMSWFGKILDIMKIMMGVMSDGFCCFKFIEIEEKKKRASERASERASTYFFFVVLKVLMV